MEKEIKLFERLITLRRSAKMLQMKIDYSKKTFRNTKEFRTYELAQMRANECSWIICVILELENEFDAYVLEREGK